MTIYLNEKKGKYMKLKKLTLKNFRAFKEEEFLFEDLSAIIGKNDTGKSSILEALDIFFNFENTARQVVKLDVDDLNIHCAPEDCIEISCVFELENDDDNYIIIDSTNRTTLKNEYMLNKDGDLEIISKWKCSGKSITKKSRTNFIVAEIPYINNNNFLTMKIDALRRELEKIKDSIPDSYNDINKSIKADIRSSLYNFYSRDAVIKEVEINISDIESDMKDLWVVLLDKIPAYFLFQADRSNTSKDDEVQSPLKAALSKSIDNYKYEFDDIIYKIVQEVSETGIQTIEKLKEFDSDIASDLVTDPVVKNYDTLFNFTINDDRGIPLEKRGSGIRRLILLSYFRVEAEKDERENKKIIYAIEEPETAQHPNYQYKIYESFREMSNNKNNQILITTHRPEIASFLRSEELILIEKNNQGYTYNYNEKNKNKKITETLGISPNLRGSFVICVEGPNDVNFLFNLNNQIPDFNQIIDLKENKLLPMHGGNLKDWVNKNYLEDSNVKEFHLYDSDVESYITYIEEMNQKDDGRRRGINTKLPEMENYVPVQLLSEKFSIEFSEDIDWKKADIPKYINNKLYDKNKLLGKNFNDSEKIVKKIINGSIVKKLTKENLIEYGVYEEIENWFIEIANWIKN